MNEPTATYELWIKAKDETKTLRVHALTGRERVSRPFHFDLQVFAYEGQNLQSFIGYRAALMIQMPSGAPRSVSGVIASVAQLATTEAGREHPYRVRLVPRLSCLKLRKNSRVFQDATVPEIVQRVAATSRIGVQLQLARTYNKRAYCVQYRETDLAFVERLLAEEGIFYWFAHATAEVVGQTGPEDALVLVDQPGVGASKDALTLSLRRGGTSVVDHDRDVTSFELRRSMRSNRVALRDYDFQRPLLDLHAEAASSTTEEELEVYRHKTDFDGAIDVTLERAKIDLEQARVGEAVGGGESRCRALGAGTLFELEVEEGEGLAGDYLVTEVRHTGRIPETSGSDTTLTYENKFSCVPATLAARPKRAPRSLDNVLATAVVVGPANEEIYVDSDGRIKIQFHWDREGGKNENSSCWVRVMQAWSGSGWGSQIIPRVGMEVLVSFLGGDQDFPVVIGCVPNAAHPLPFALPRSKTRSGIKTQSYPGAGGSNELSFEDARGQEQVYLHAERDLDEMVEHDHTRVVKNDEKTRVEGAVLAEVRGDRTDIVGGKLTQTLQGDELTTVTGNRVDAVTGNVEAKVAADLITRVGRSERREVTGRSDLSIDGDYTVRTKGCYTNIIGRHDKKRSYVVRVEGTAQFSSSQAFEVESEKALVLRSGKSFIRISDERIEIVSPAVAVRGEGSGLTVEEGKLKIRSKSETLLTSEKILLKTPDASVGLKKDVEVAGAKILLNSPNDAKDPVKDESKPPTKIKLSDAAGKSLAYQRFLIKMEDGSEYSGILDKDGAIDMELDGKGTITFPDTSNAA
ncbi:MAG: type VI secretion system tip protein TssI/VgrG [Polyangiaceae bacterium]